jgi:two-component system response regulator LytT
VKLVLLEDEPPALAQLTRAVQAARPDAEIVATFDTVADARAWFTTNPGVAELAISDIQLADGLALPLFAALDVPVIFATAFDQWLLDAFRCAAVDYLLKPIAHEDVARAFEKHARLRASLRSPSDLKSDLKSDLNALADMVREPRRRLLVRRGAELRAVSVDDVAYLIAEDKLTLLVTRTGAEHVVDKTLAALELELDPRAFFRAHRGALVHVSAIKGVRSVGKGRLLLTLEPRPKDDVVVPQEHGAAFRAWFDR